jgi:hypothetical protein
VQEFLLVLFLDHLSLTFLLLLAVAVVVEVVPLLKPEVEEELVVYVPLYLQLVEEQVLNQAFLLVTEAQPLLTLLLAQVELAEAEVVDSALMESTAL